jgi:hypothetical protein
MLPEAVSYERAAARIARLMLAIAGVGTALCLSRWGWKAGAGFLIGSLLSGVQYYALKTVVDGLDGKPMRGSGIRAAARFLALATLAYVIFRLTPVSLKAALAGIFVLTLAVFFEVAIEIAYARK